MTIGTFRAVDRHGAELDFEVQNAGVKEANEAEMQYRISYSRALSMGIIPRDKMIDILRTNEVWDEELNRELVALTAAIALSEKELKAAEKRNQKNESLKAATELAKQRGRMWEIMSIQAKPLAHSCEGYAEIVRAEALLASQVHVKGVQGKYWPTYKDYVLERDEDPRSSVSTKMMDFQNEFLMEQRKEILDNTPEQKFFVKSKVEAEKSAETVKKKSKTTRKKTSKKTPRKKSGTKASNNLSG
jgi:hypothetical protein